MGRIFNKKQAIDYLGLDDKIFDNYFKNANEFDCLKREGKSRYQFDENVLLEWKKNRNWRTVELDIDDYALCLDFALAQHFRGYVLSDWGTARQREFGQKITNWIKGQLAEVAVRKFFKREFGTRIELDFEIHDKIVAQDIIGIIEKGKKRLPKIGVGIKSSKPKSAYLVLGDNEVTLKERRSDIYIFCRPDIPDDHLLRLTIEEVRKTVENQPHYLSYYQKMPIFENMLCEIAGYCSINELEKVKGIPGQEFDGIRHVRKSGELHRQKEEWQALINQL